MKFARCINLVFRKAQHGEEQAIHQLYRSVVGTEFCVWDDDYPGYEQINYDLNGGNLYVLSRDGDLVGAISLIPEHEMEELETLPFWAGRGPAFSFARVVVSPSMQGNGYAAKLVRNIEKIILKKGGTCVRILAAVGNIPAIRTYEKEGYQTAGPCFLFGHNYFGMEKDLV
jgi:ribosomal protein S18 acetylase RimI-like enzyme